MALKHFLCIVATYERMCDGGPSPINAVSLLSTLIKSGFYICTYGNGKVTFAEVWAYKMEKSSYVVPWLARLTTDRY